MWCSHVVLKPVGGEQVPFFPRAYWDFEELKKEMLGEKEGMLHKERRVYGRR